MGVFHVKRINSGIIRRHWQFEILLQILFYFTVTNSLSLAWTSPKSIECTSRFRNISQGKRTLKTNCNDVACTGNLVDNHDLALTSFKKKKNSQRGEKGMGLTSNFMTRHNFQEVFSLTEKQNQRRRKNTKFVRGLVTIFFFWIAPLRLVSAKSSHVLIAATEAISNPNEITIFQKTLLCMKYNLSAYNIFYFIAAFMLIKETICVVKSHQRQQLDPTSEVRIYFSIKLPISGSNWNVSRVYSILI